MNRTKDGYTYSTSIYEEELTITKEPNKFPSHQKIDNMRNTAVGIGVMLNLAVFFLFKNNVEQYLRDNIENFTHYGMIEYFVYFIVSFLIIGIVIFSSFGILRTRKGKSKIQEILSSEHFGKERWAKYDIEMFESMENYPEVMEDFMKISRCISVDNEDKAQRALDLMMDVVTKEEYMYKKKLSRPVDDLNKTYSYQLQALQEIQ